MFAEDLVDRRRVGGQADGLGWLATQCAPFTLERTEAATGVPADAVRELARSLVGTPRAAVYGRIGTCAGRSGTLTSHLIDAVNPQPATSTSRGSVFGSFGFPAEGWAFTALGALLRYDYRRNRSRVGGFGNLVHTEPATMLARRSPPAATDRSGTVRQRRQSGAVGTQRRGTGRGHAATGPLGRPRLLPHRDHRPVRLRPAGHHHVRARRFPVLLQPFHATPFRQSTEAVVPPQGQARTEWEIVDDLMARMAKRSPVFAALAAARASAGLFGRRLSPRPLIDLMIRTGRGGDWFGLRPGGLSFRSLTEQHPHGVVLEPDLPTGVLGRAVAYTSRRIRLRHHEIAEQIEQLRRRKDPIGYPLRLIGMRDARSENSWMHNAPLLMRGDRRPRALMHATDATLRGIADGDDVWVRSPYGKIELPVRLTEDIVAGTVAIPHGWGHNGKGGWRLANGVGGVNVNELTSNDPDDVESLSGMAWLSGSADRGGALVT